MLELEEGDIVIRDTEDPKRSSVWVDGKWKAVDVDRGESLNVLARTRIERSFKNA